MRLWEMIARASRSCRVLAARDNANKAPLWFENIRDVFRLYLASGRLRLRVCRYPSTSILTSLDLSCPNFPPPRAALRSVTIGNRSTADHVYVEISEGYVCFGFDIPQVAVVLVRLSRKELVAVSFAGP